MPLIIECGNGAVLGGILLAVMGWRLDPGTSRLPVPILPLLIAFSMAGLGIWLLLHPGLKRSALPPVIAVETLYDRPRLHHGLCRSPHLNGLPPFYLCASPGPARWWRSKAAILAPDRGACRRVSLVLFRVLLRVPFPGDSSLPKGGDQRLMEAWVRY